jgi:hypothetical protein
MRPMSRHSVVNGTIVIVLLALALWTTISQAGALSSEGVRLLAKSAIFIVVLLVTAFARTVVGRNRRRQFGMFLGTIGGLAIGVAMASRLNEWSGMDVSPLAAIGGIFCGWLVAYSFVRHIPRGGPASPTPRHTW